MEPVEVIAKKIDEVKAEKAKQEETAACAKAAIDKKLAIHKEAATKIEEMLYSSVRK